MFNKAGTSLTETLFIILKTMNGSKTPTRRPGSRFSLPLTRYISQATPDSGYLM